MTKYTPPLHHLLILSLLITGLILFPGGALSASEESSSLRKGIEEYRDESYEEALASLLKAYEVAPDSAETAYYLGLTYREMLRYEEAREYLEKALSLNPAFDDASIALGEVLFGLNRYEEAERVLMEVAEEADPAYRAYLRGFVSLKRKDFDTAIEQFETAISYDESYRQRGRYYSGLAYLGKGMTEEAEAALREAIALDRKSIIAHYAKRGLEGIPAGGEEKPFQLTLGYSFRYDDNVILKPSEEVSGVAISDESDFRHVFTLRTDYVPKGNGTVNLRGSYLFYQSIHHDLSELNLQAHRITITPSLPTQKGTVSLITGIDYFSLDNDGYLLALSLKPTYVYDASERKRFILSAGVSRKEFLQDPSNSDEDRNGTNLKAGIAYLSMEPDGSGYLSIGYAIDKDFTEGSNWDYTGNRVHVALLHPLPNSLALRASVIYNFQLYDNSHSTYGKKRRDHIVKIAPGLIYRYGDFILKLQYSHSRSESNITAYDYARNIYGAGIEYSY